MQPTESKGGPTPGRKICFCVAKWSDSTTVLTWAWLRQYFLHVCNTLRRRTNGGWRAQAATPWDQLVLLEIDLVHFFSLHFLTIFSLGIPL